MQFITKHKALFLSLCIVLGLLATQAKPWATRITRNQIAIQAVLIHFENKSIELAEEIVLSDKALHKTTTDQATLRLVSHIYLYADQMQYAANTLTGNSTTCPDIMTCYLQGQILYASGHTEQAINTWRNVQYTDQYFAFQGDSAFKQGDKNKALGLYDLSWRIASTPTPKKTTMLLNLCREYRNIEDMATAIYWCEQAVRSQNNYWTTVELGRTYYENGQFELAEEYLGKAIRLSPQDGSAYYWLGLTLSRTEREQEAIEALHHSVQLDPNNVWAHFDLAQNLAASGAYLEAACEYFKARDLTEQKDMQERIKERLSALPIKATEPHQCAIPDN